MVFTNRINTLSIEVASGSSKAYQGETQQYASRASLWDSNGGGGRLRNSCQQRQNH
jgi:hypothetical protein